MRSLRSKSRCEAWTTGCPAGALRSEARELFDRTIVPRDFDRVEIPLPERGDPVHVRGDAERSQVVT